MKENRIVVTGLGPTHPEMLAELVQCCADYHCSIMESNWACLGQQLTFFMLVRGSWDAIAKLESALGQAARRFELQLLVKHTAPAEEESGMAYSIHVTAADRPGILHDLARFLKEKRITIADLQSMVCPSPGTSTCMCYLNVSIRINADTHLAALRDDFMLFCDERNLDAILEPARIL